MKQQESHTEALPSHLSAENALAIDGTGDARQFTTRVAVALQIDREEQVRLDNRAVPLTFAFEKQRLICVCRQTNFLVRQLE